MLRPSLAVLLVVFFAEVIPAASADTVSVVIHRVDAAGVGEHLGSIKFSDSPAGLRIMPQLSGLSPGTHGFHLHANPTCEAAEKSGRMAAAEAAGGHYDPAHTGKHEGPSGAGHKGDLPPLSVAPDGSATKEEIAPRLRVADLASRAVMIHAGGDNFSDVPLPLGGGGERIACGVIEEAARVQDGQ